MSPPPGSRIVAPPPGPAATPSVNAVMTVAAWRGRKHLDSWTGPTLWTGTFGTFHARVRGRTVIWKDGSLTGVHVKTDARGQGGIPLARWLPRGTTRVTVTIAEHGFGQNPGGGTGKARSSATGPTRPDSDPGEGRSALRSSSGTGNDGSAAGELSDEHEADLIRALEAGDRSRRSETGAGDRKPEAGTGGRGRKPEPRTGTGAGGEPDGDAGGQRGGFSAAEGGVGDAYAARVDGQKFGDPEGARGGDGNPGDAGARGAFALFGGAIDVPRDLRAAVEIALAIDDAAVFGLGKKFFKRGARKFTTTATTRRALASEARRHAAARLRITHKKLGKKRAFRKLSRDQQHQVLRATYWDLQYQYFDGVAHAAKKQQRALNKKLGRVRKAGDRAKQAALQRDLDYANRVAEAAEVKPIAGRLPRNHELAGSAVPASRLPKKFRSKGLRFTDQGFPDFAPHAFTLPNGKKSVRIQLTGRRSSDFSAANRAAGFDKKPQGYTWHHHENQGVMVLVPTEIHRGVSHTGGAAFYKHVTGAVQYD